MIDKTKEKTITFNITQKEAQALLSASITFFEEQVKPLKEKKLGISGRHFSTCLTLHTYGKGSNRYKDYNYLSAFKTIYGNK